MRVNRTMIATAWAYRDVVMRSIQDHRGLDVQKIQHELIDFFASESRPGPYVPNYLLAYLASYARSA